MSSAAPLRELIGAKRRARRRPRWQLLLLLLMGLFAAYVGILFVQIMGHQLWQEQYRDDAFLSVSEHHFAPQGIVLRVRSKTPIVAVKNQDGPPFRPIADVPHRVLRDARTGEYLVLAGTPFGRGEWYLELYSADGHWQSMSPYFPPRPDLTEADWHRLWAVPNGARVELP